MKSSNLELIKKFGRNEKDSGSCEVQIAILSQKIEKLSQHLKDNKKDFHSYYGLMKMVNKRKNVTKYLKSQDGSRHKNILTALNLRK